MDWRGVGWFVGLFVVVAHVKVCESGNVQVEAWNLSFDASFVETSRGDSHLRAEGHGNPVLGSDVVVVVDEVSCCVLDVAVGFVMKTVDDLTKFRDYRGATMSRVAIPPLQALNGWK
jgi:hypothetical protein